MISYNDDDIQTSVTLAKLTVSVLRDTAIGCNATLARPRERISLSKSWWMGFEVAVYSCAHNKRSRLRLGELINTHVLSRLIIPFVSSIAVRYAVNTYVCLSLSLSLSFILCFALWRIPRVVSPSF